MNKTKNEEMMLEKYLELKNKNENLQMQYSQLVISENKIRSDYENLNEHLAEINKKITIYSDKIDSIIKYGSENNVLSNENLKKKCVQNFNIFFLNKDRSNKDATSLYEFQIEYSNTVFKRSLEKENMTFQELKREMKYQIGRSENEFFFCDANKSIFLDDFKIKDVLFPFGKVILRKNIPRIKIIENNPDNEILIDTEKIENGKMIIEEETNVKDSPKNQFLEMIKNIISRSIFSLMFLIFLFFWAFTIIQLRDVKNYFLMNHTFEYKNMFSMKHSSDSILDDVKKFYADLFGFPEENSTLIYSKKKLNRKNLNLTYT